MIVDYHGAHKVIFEVNGHEYDTWRDWFLVPTKKPVIVPPKPKYKIIDIPGGNGSIDLSETLTGEPIYENRNGSLEFIMPPELVYSSSMTWPEIYSNILNAVNGQAVKLYLDDDSYYYYEGRIHMTEFTDEGMYYKATFEYDLGPYKIERYATQDDWLWDEFDFNTGIVRDGYYEYSVGDENGDTTITIDYPGSRRTFRPYFVVELYDASSTITINGHQVSANGQYWWHDVAVKGDSTPITISGRGTVYIKYRGGSL